MVVVVVEVAVTVVKSYLCHVCHKDMEERNISPFMEWHICDKCMDESELPIDPKYRVKDV